jgi:hypothetical protein
MRSVSGAPHIAARARQEAAVTIPKGALFSSRLPRRDLEPRPDRHVRERRDDRPDHAVTLQATTGALTGPTGSTFRVRFCANDRVNDEVCATKDVLVNQRRTDAPTDHRANVCRTRDELCRRQR